jgi:RNA polymerase-binding transcription factor DksA
MYSTAAGCHHAPMRTTSDDQLRAIRARLVGRSAELSERIRQVQDGLGCKAVPLPRDAPDAAIVMENDEILHAVNESARAELGQIERALERLETGTFGTCEICGEKIDAERLRVVPYTGACRRCAPEA